MPPVGDSGADQKHRRMECSSASSNTSREDPGVASEDREVAPRFGRLLAASAYQVVHARMRDHILVQ